jgi:hypothetical protein
MQAKRLQGTRTMTQVFRFARLNLCGVAVLAAVSSLTLAAQDNSKAAIQQKLESQFKLTKITADRSDLVTPGDIITLKKDSIGMKAVSGTLPTVNIYRDGRVSQGALSGFLRGIVNQTNNGGDDVPSRSFASGEKCWLTGIEVKDDGAYFTLYSDPYDDVRYYGVLKVAFKNKKTIPPVDDVLKLVAEVVSAEPMAASTPPAPMTPPAPLAEIAPPPPPADVAPPTIALGQTRDQVTANFGQPNRVAKVGAKVIFYYQDMKVTFVSGKVSAVD